jgi:UDP-N-acetylmuramoyl-L-alanyl-D-glutamate--2,6-diaminopimelate ligase
MRLSELIAGLYAAPHGIDPEIAGISEDSRLIRRGMLFVAVAGTALDGHAYVSDAVARGAAAIVAERTGAIPHGVPAIRVSSSRVALAELAARFHGEPAAELTTIGFTGTFGKTSTSDILRALLDAGGARTGVVGSLGARFRAYRDPGSGLTTPAPVELHRYLRQLKSATADTVIVEVTSHALRMERVRGIRFDGGLIGAILPGEHTDFHRSYEDYVDAKRLFLDHLGRDAVLAYDADNRASRQLASSARVRKAVGLSIDRQDGDLQVYEVLLDAHGAAFSISGLGTAGQRLHSPLLGRGHLRNVALALTYALAVGVPADLARETVARLEPLPRRMEHYFVGGRRVLDDTAAHPESFRAALDVAAVLPARELILVYAIRGNRGRDINRRNALALADLAAVHGVTTVVVTAAIDCATGTDRAAAEETDATREAFVERGRRFVWHDTLEGSLAEALARGAEDDLIVLLGAQGMNSGRRLLENLVGGARNVAETPSRNV